MNTTPKLLDLYCCEGGAAVGYQRAGFDVTGVDLYPQSRYPFEFVQADAIEYVKAHGHEYDAIHASPPCQAYSLAQRIQGRDHDRLIAATREAIEATGLPYIIENVAAAEGELIDPLMLCGAMFGLETYRHRLFESNVELEAPEHPVHVAKTTKMGRAPRDGEFMHIVGNFSGVDRGREVMGMPWASRDGLREAIPPAYTEHLGRQLMLEVARRRHDALERVRRWASGRYPGSGDYFAGIDSAQDAVVDILRDVGVRS